jgi:glycosyltransferase involved in cell wall biosynthesis
VTKTVPKCIALVYSSDFHLYRFRQGLIRTLKEQGCTVLAVTPPGRYVEALERAGARFVPWNVNPRGINPFKELRSLLALRRIYREFRPNVAHHFTIKPNVYGAFAARFAGGPSVVASVTGLGYMLASTTGMAKAVRAWVGPLCRLSFRLSDVVTFQNTADRDLLVERNLVAAEKTRYMPGGSGVDLGYFHPAAPDHEAVASLRRELQISEGAVVVALIARMLWEKGVGEYHACALALRDKFAHLRFLLVGPTEDSVPGFIPTMQLKEWSQDGVLSYLGERQDVRDILALTDVVVLPTYYGEGVPRVLLEAAAMGIPAVTTDTSSCREAVEQGVTGLLVRSRDEVALRSAVEKLVLDRQLRLQLGGAAREKAEREFDEKKVIDQFLSIYDHLLEEGERRSSQGS